MQNIFSGYVTCLGHIKIIETPVWGCNGFCFGADDMDTKGTDEVEKMKSKIMSTWHNLKYST